jgi:NADP-dependent 3-hydroxy acid dehydrogenase YdfG
VINISSLAGSHSMRNASLYSATKAAVAVFLASDASCWVTGETIRVGGGAR